MALRSRVVTIMIFQFRHILLSEMDSSFKSIAENIPIIRNYFSIMQITSSASQSNAWGGNGRRLDL